MNENINITCLTDEEKKMFAYLLNINYLNYEKVNIRCLIGEEEGLLINWVFIKDEQYNMLYGIVNLNGKLVKARVNDITFIKEDGEDIKDEKDKIYEYQKSVIRTMNQSLSYKEQLINAMMGINGEAGEAMDILKKVLFQGHDLQINKANIIEELGDVLWYLTLATITIGYTLSDVMDENMKKLSKRYPNGFNSSDSVRRVDVKND